MPRNFKQIEFFTLAPWGELLNSTFIDKKINHLILQFFKDNGIQSKQLPKPDGIGSGGLGLNWFLLPILKLKTAYEYFILVLGLVLPVLQKYYSDKYTVYLPSSHIVLLAKNSKKYKEDEVTSAEDALIELYLLGKSLQKTISTIYPHLKITLESSVILEKYNHRVSVSNAHEEVYEYSQNILYKYVKELESLSIREKRNKTFQFTLYKKSGIKLIIGPHEELNSVYFFTKIDKKLYYFV